MLLQKLCSMLRVEFKQTNNRFREIYDNIFQVMIVGNFMHLYYRDQTKIVRQKFILMRDLDSLQITEVN